MTSTRFRLLLAVALLGGSTSAQTIAVLETYRNATGATEPFTRIVAGHLTGHHTPDVVALSGSTVRLAPAPQLVHARYLIPGAANDFAILPKGNTALGTDALVIVGSDGLKKWTWDPTANQQENPPGAATLQSMDTSPTAALWNGAKRVRVLQLDSTPTYGLVGIKSDNTTLLVRLGVGSGTATSEISVGGPVEAMETVQWDSSANHEIALVTSGGLRIYSTTANPPLLVNVTGYTHQDAPPDTLVRVREGSATDKLVWITVPNEQYADQCARVLKHQAASPNYSQEFPPLDVGELGVVACAAEDGNLDGKDDLLISQKLSTELIFAINLSGPSSTVTFDNDPAHGMLIPWGPGSASQNQTTPAVVDWDGDGDNDVVFADMSPSGAARLLLFRSFHRNERWFRTKVGGVDSIDGATAHEIEGLLVDVKRPTDRFGFNPNRVEIVVWAQQGSSPPFTLEASGPAPIGKKVVAIPTPVPLGANLSLLDDVEVTFPVMSKANLILSIQTRLLTIDGSTTTAHPAFLGSFAPTEDLMKAIEDYYDPSGGFNTLIENPITGSYGGAPPNDPIAARGAVPRPQFDPFDEDTIPLPEPLAPN